MYYLDENMAEEWFTPGAARRPQPVATPNNAVAKPTVDSRPPGNVAANKPADIQKNAAALPAASANTNKITTSGPVEDKTVDASEGSWCPMSRLTATTIRNSCSPTDLETGFGGCFERHCTRIASPGLSGSGQANANIWFSRSSCSLGRNRKVVSATAMSGPITLRDAAVQAALRAKFSPTKLSGQPVKVSGVINYKFALVP